MIKFNGSLAEVAKEEIRRSWGETIFKKKWRRKEWSWIKNYYKSSVWGW